MIYFDEYGDKENPTILLLHGAMALHTFTQQYEILKDYHLVVPHLYGAGESIKIKYDANKLKEQLVYLIKSLNKPQIIIIGHSIGAQLTVMLVAENPTLFAQAIFLSAWVIPNEKSINTYCNYAPITVKLLRNKWLIRLQAKYWRYTKEQTDELLAYAPKMTVENYEQFFKQTLNIEHFPQFFNVKIPMLAICGGRESKDIKDSLQLLAKNSYCRTMLLSKAAHDFPMRGAKQLNPIINGFLEGE